MQNRYTFGMATVVMLVLLRLNIGWHFYCEGTKHATDPSWSSEGFLRAAQGPLAPMFQSVLPGDYGLKEIVHSDLSGVQSAQAWTQGVTDEWQTYFDQFNEYYKLSDEQRKVAEKLVRRRQSQLQSWMGENREAIVTHKHEWDRIAQAEQVASADDVPYQKKRISDQEAKLTTEAKGWLAQVHGIEAELRHDLDRVLIDEQRHGGSLGASNATLKTVDTVMTYGILAIGAALILGLFTRTACVLGAVFLLQVVLTQPFWVTEASPTFNQFVEMFALLTLATTHVGRWAGLDFFVHHLLIRQCGAAKGQCDVPQS